MFSHLDIEHFLARIKSVNILVIGDVMLDRYLFGHSERISPEAPIPVVSVGREEFRLGGAANVANNLAAIGCKVQLVSVVGRDTDGDTLRRQSCQVGIDVRGLVTAEERMTTVKTRVIAGSQQLLRIDQESTQDVTGEDARQLLAYVEEVLPGINGVILSDYCKGVLTSNFLGQVLKKCQTCGCPVVVDPKRTDWQAYAGATVLTPNLKELTQATGVKVGSADSLIAAATIAMSFISTSALLVTRGKDGMTLFEEDLSLDIAAENREVFDVSGAGDTVSAFIAAGLSCGLSLERSVKLANMAAGIAVSKIGTATVSGEELKLQAFKLRPADLEYSGKLFERQDLAILLDDARKEGRRVVFTNGCFDLLHAGHVKYLQQAKQLGDLLVLGLNSDASVRRLKGEKRPLLAQNERAQLLSALDCIDYLCIFDDDTPYELIRLLRPQVLVKGGDYTDKEVVGRDLVESDGGQVVLIDMVAGRSTSHIIDEVLTRYRD